MSVIDDLQGLENRVKERMRELRPLLAEYQELEQVARRLGVNLDDATAESASEPSTPRAARGSAARGSRSPRRSASTQTRRQPGTRARSGGRREQLLDLVRQQPGITVRDAGQKLGVDGTSLYRVVRRLEQEGAVKKEGRGLQPA
jgi:transcriptional regulator of acetoin/glycerol metabolism